ncbi:ankyrin repeat domain-containing protein [Micromonospora sp. NPDC023737]|uniref:ankyrin repeat domain-containing protein n=1 Tax=unclassified Micromonospora TaxID=2617518 RepID=UPI0033EF6348
MDDELHRYRRQRPQTRKDQRLRGVDVAAILDMHFGKADAPPSELADAFCQADVPIHHNEHIAAAALVAPAVLRLLLAYAADANQQHSDATPAIVVAARRGDHAAADVLLEADADVNARDRQGRTALMHAVDRNERRVIATLLLAGAAIDTVSADDMTALQLARGWQRQNIQFMLGERHAGLDDVPIVRTALRVGASDVRLAGDPQMLHLLADVIDVALRDLGDDEWNTRTGTDTEVARASPEQPIHAQSRPAAGDVGSQDLRDGSVSGRGDTSGQGLHRSR